MKLVPTCVSLSPRASADFVQRRDRLPVPGTRRRRSRESGYAFLMALFAMLIFAAGTITLLTNLSTEGRRIREEETVWRGEQYERAIRLYYHKTGHYPQRIDDLTKGVPGVHFLRQAYKDPMNKTDGAWRFIYVNGSGQITGSVRYATLQQMVLLDQYAGLLPGGAPIGQPPGQIGVSAASLSSMGAAQNPLSALVPGSTSGAATGIPPNLQIDPSQIAQYLQQNGQNIDPALIAQFLQQNGQNIDPSQISQFLQQNGQNIDPSQIAQYLQNAQGGQNSPDSQNLQNPQNSQDPQVHQYQPPDPNAPIPQNPPTDDTQDTLIPGVPVSGSQGFGSTGVPINPLLVMKPTGPVDGPVVGGFLTGVASTVDAKSVKVYRGAKKYNRWEFIWNPLEDAVSSGQQGTGGTGGGLLPGQASGGIAPGGIGGNNPNSSFGGSNPPPAQPPQQPPPQ